MRGSGRLVIEATVGQDAVALAADGKGLITRVQLNDQRLALL